MKIVALLICLLPMVIWSQKFIDIPLNQDETDIVYEAIIKYDNPLIKFSELVNVVSSLAEGSNLSNIQVDTLKYEIVANGMEVINDMKTNQYQHQYNYMVLFSMVPNQIVVKISKIYHHNKVDVLKSMGYCYGFRNKDTRFKYFDVLTEMNIKINNRIDEFKKGVLSMNLIDKSEKVVSNETVITYVDDLKSKVVNNQLSQNDYLLKSAESLNLFYKQKRNSFYFSAIGLGTIFVAAAIDNNRQKASLTTSVMSVLGGGLMFTGFVLNIDSYKHVRNSSMYLKKSAEGITVGIKF